MPEIKLSRVISVSSEDKAHSATNLLAPSGAGVGWKCAAGGENSCSVILELAESAKISSVHLGNLGSAFVEVLVGRATQQPTSPNKQKSPSKDEGFQVLVIASSLMTLQESRKGENTQCVKMFGTDKLVPTVASERWDRVKLVCKQPFNKTAQYGLAFVSVFGETSQTSLGSSSEIIGSFHLKPEMDEGQDDIKTGGFFKRLKETTPSKPGKVSLAASMKSSDQHDTLDIPVIHTPSSAESQSKRKHSASPAGASSVQKTSGESVPTPPKRHKMAESKTESSRIDQPAQVSSSPVQRPFDQLLCDVVFVLSGFQNPLRGELRAKGVEMGARYLPDWNSKCTHLICAYQNTPKFNQVKEADGGRGKFKIVQKEWILECHSEKKRFPIAKYSMLPLTVEDKVERVVCSMPAEQRGEGGGPFTSAGDVGADECTQQGEAVLGYDTDEEIKKVTEPQSVYDAETDDDDYEGDDGITPTDIDQSQADTSSSLPVLPDLFNKAHFFLFGKFSEEVRRQLKRFIVAYDGVLDNYMNDKVSYVVANEPNWCQDFDAALQSNASLVFLKADWLYACDHEQRLVPFGTNEIMA